jgi:L-2,4-diaminobutyrate decarboxylase
VTMHEPTDADVAAARETLEWMLGRLADRRSTLPPASLAEPLPALTAQGIGAEAALRLLRDEVFPTAIPPDHPRFLAFVPGTPTVAAAIADMALSAAMVFGGSRLEAGVAADAEDAALRWLADAAGFPASAQGTFVSGGSIANLSALVAARGDRYAAVRRQVIVAGASAHSSMAAAARVMGCDLVVAPPADAHGRLSGATLTAALAGHEPDAVVAVVATGGATNNGAVDDLAGVAEVCSSRGIWLHVDGAYGGAALLSPRARPLFEGIERADSFIVNPHKWLYAPFDCAALLYRDGVVARRALTQEADYLDAISDDVLGNPSDLAVHLTRRPRGLPLWASVLASGTASYTEAVEHCLDVAAYAAERIGTNPALELALEPALTVVLLRRLGWAETDYVSWSEAALRSGLAMVMPTKHAGETLLRFCFINPLTTLEDVDLVLSDLSQRRV